MCLAHAGPLYIGDPWNEPARANVTNVMYFRRELTPDMVLKSFLERRVPTAALSEEQRAKAEQDGAKAAAN